MDVIPGCVTRQAVIQAFNEWTRPLADGEESADTVKVPEYLIGVSDISDAGFQYPPLPAGLRVITEPEFSYIVLGEYPVTDTKQLISEEWINAARQRWDAYVAEFGEKAPEYVHGVMGQDVGEYGKDPSVSCFRYGGFCERLVRWKSVDPHVTGKKAAQEYKARRISKAFVDAIGVGSSVPGHMIELGCNAIGVKINRKNPNKKRYVNGIDAGGFESLWAELLWEVREYLRTDPYATLPPEQMLIEELMTIMYWEHGKNAEIRMTSNDDIKKLLKRSSDDMCAYLLTFAQGGYFSDCNME
jgi:hypothetical protein